MGNPYTGSRERGVGSWELGAGRAIAYKNLIKPLAYLAYNRIKRLGDVLDVLLAILQTLFSKGFQLLSHTFATPPLPGLRGSGKAICLIRLYN
jgi:hypothetical protein